MYEFQNRETSEGIHFYHQNLNVFFGNKFHKPENLTVQYPQIKFQFINQTHSTHLTSYPKVLKECDGYQWSEKNFSTIIRTADCLPLIAIDHSLQKISNLHCGRVGLVNGILNTFIENSHTDHYHSFFIGPHITTYEIGYDLFEDLKRKNIEGLEVINNDKYLFSLAQFTKNYLKQKFSSFKIYECNINTLTNDSFWSYRRDKGTIHRNLSYAYIEEK